MGQGRKVAARTDAAAHGDDRRDVVVQHVAQPLGDHRPNAGKTQGDDVGADQHHRANHVRRQRIADAAAVGADQVLLHLLDVRGFEADVSEQTDARIESVDGLVAVQGLVDLLARRPHLVQC